MHALKSIQPEKLEMRLREAHYVPAKPLEEQKQKMGVVCGIIFAVFSLVIAGLTSAWYFFFPKKGIPHGVEAVPMTLEMVRIGDNGTSIAYCESRRPRTRRRVPSGDGLPYPNRVESFMVCEVPKDGYYDVELDVTINGSVKAVVTKATPCATPTF